MIKRPWGALLCAALSMPAFAQQSAEAPDAAAASETPPLTTIAVETGAAEPLPAPARPVAVRGIEEVIVTAQKREERLQDVPIAISAFSGDFLEDHGVKTIKDLASSTPSLIIDDVANYAIIYVRGVGTDAFVPSADLSVAPYIDGVYFPMTFNLAHALGEVERIEILKGPQGTLFGRNATGGAINIITKQPDDHLSGSANVEIGNYDALSSRLYLSGPIVDTLSGAFSLLVNTKDEYYTPVAPATLDHLQPYRDLALNAKLRWQPSDVFDATLSGFLFDTRGIGSVLFTCLSPSVVGAALGISCADGYHTNSEHDARASSKNKAGILTLNVHPDRFDIKSITGYQNSTSAGNPDFDGSSANLVIFNGANFGGKIFSQELQVLSNEESPWAEHLNWIVGFYMLDSEIYYDPVAAEAAGLEQGLSGLGNGTIPAPTVPFLNFFADQLSLLSFADDIVQAAPSVTGFLDTRAYALFAQTTIKPTDWLELTLGGRMQKERRKVYDATLGVRGVLFGQEFEQTLVRWPEDDTDKRNFSPKATLAFKPDDDVMFYVSYQRAYKSGSFNIVNLTTPPTYIRPETVTATEIGWKTTLFDRSLQFNGALFNNDIEDLQSQFVSLLSGGVIQFQNAQKARVRGAEANLIWMPLSGLQFSGGATYLDGTYRRFTDASGYNPAGVFNGGNNYSGNRIVRNPKYAASTGISYTRDLSDSGTGEAGIDYFYSDKYYFDAQNSLVQKSYDLLSARLRYTYNPWDLSITAFGANLMDTKYYIYQLQTDFSVLGKYAWPRTYGLRIDWKF